MGRVSNPECHKEYIDLMKFIVEKSKNVEGALNIKQMIREFIEFSGSILPLESLKKRFYKGRMRIHEVDEFDFETKVRILVATSASVDFNFLKELEKQATVEVDEENRILNYISNDGTLKLKGDHSRSTKRKSKIREELSSNDFKGEEWEFDVEYEYEDVEGENLEDNNNESIVRSGRVLKKRFESHEHDSSTKKKAKKNTNFIDSPSTSSSFNFPPGVQRTEPSNNVIYGSPGEPSLPIPLNIKRETIQYQMHPDYQFYLYNMQLQSEHRLSHVDDDVEFENPQISDKNQHDREVKMETEDEEIIRDTYLPVNESTSSDEFLKFLQNFVKTLNSELLHDLEKDIGKAMAKLRSENRKVLIKDIEMSLRTALTMIIKVAKPRGESSENTKSLMGFLMVFNMFALNNSALTGVQHEIQEAMKELGDEDKTVSIKNIRIVLEPMLLFVTS